MQMYVCLHLTRRLVLKPPEHSLGTHKGKFLSISKNLKNLRDKADTVTLPVHHLI